ncbi:MAG: hypothetical protein HZB57_07050 [Gammaproteobacteria bacterium]|nr:hypothetical protein [Gammaproteobacteria bacterium]
MPNLDLKDARIGMVLDQDMLLSAGAVLSDKHLQELYANQVQQVAVGTTAPTVPNATLAFPAIEAYIEERFQICDAGQPLIQELRCLCHKRFTPVHEGPDDD